MANMTMLVFEKDGAQIMLTEADAINRALLSGEVHADTLVTLYLSDRSSAHMRAAEHPQLAAYFSPEPEPELASEPITESAEPMGMTERLRALEADLDEGGASWSSPAPHIAHAMPAPQNYRIPSANPSRTKGRKSRIVAAFLAAVLGVLGVHKFYLGKTRIGWFTLAAFVAGAIFYTPLAKLVFVVVLLEAVFYLLQSDDNFQDMVDRG